MIKDPQSVLKGHGFSRAANAAERFGALAPEEKKGPMDVDAEKKLLSVAAEKIKRDAPIQGVDFADPAHAFTVWTEFPSNFMKHCGSCKSLDEATAWALKHVNHKTLYIVRGPLDALDIIKVETGKP